MVVSAWRAGRVWIGIMLLMLGIGGGQGQVTVAPNQGSWQPQTFPISAWCSPPEPFIMVEQYRQYAEAGLNVLLPPCEGEATLTRNRKMLDTARRVGLKVIVQDARMPMSLKDKPKAEQAIKAIVNDYRKHPALLGYFITDEPGANQFAGLADVARLLHQFDPNHLVYINLLPNYATTDLTAKPSQLNTETYDQYVEKFVATVQPDVLSWDFYHFLEKGNDRPGFFGNLEAIQKAALATTPATPFWQIVLSVKHGPYRALNENELRFEAMQTLVYGAHGLVYFTYWLPQSDKTFQWSDSIRKADGTPGPLYAAVKNVNHEVSTLAKWLYPAQVFRTFQTGEVAPDAHGQPEDVPVRVVGPGNLSVGLFRDGKGYLYVMVANRDYTKPVTTKLALYIGKRVIERLDLASGKWSAVKADPNENDEATLPVDLGPSGAALIRWL